MTPEARPRRVALFLRLGPWSLAVALLFRLLGFRVRYIQAAPCFMTAQAVAALAFLGLEMLDHGREERVDPLRYYLGNHEEVQALYADLYGQEDEAALARLFGPLERLGNKMRIVRKDCLNDVLGRIFHLLYWAAVFRRENARVVAFAPGNYFVDAVLRRNRIPNYCPWWIGWVRVLPGAAAFAWKALPRRRPAVAAAAPAAAKTSGLSPAEARVLYYPHQSVFYGALFKKDHFYDPRPGSPLHMTRILHLEKRPQALPPGAVEHYRANGVPFAFECDLQKRGELVRAAAAAIWRYLPFMFREKGRGGACGIAGFVHRHVLFCLAWCRYAAYLRLLDKMPEARICLVGYDYMFPRILSLALERKGIRTVATQERFIQSFYPFARYIFDTYCIIGPRVRENLTTALETDIKHLVEIGGIRFDLLHEYRKVAPPAPAGRTRVLALDFHSYPDPLCHCGDIDMNWDMNKEFYLDMIRLAVRFPGLDIVIRGKNADWLDIPAFREVREVIAALPNIRVDADYSRLNISYELAAASDLIIAKHTSLADETLAAGIPTLFHDYAGANAGFVSRLHDYRPYPLFVTSYDALEARVGSFLETGRIMDDALFARLRQDCYGSHCDGHVGARLHRLLADIAAQCGLTGAHDAPPSS